jgi:5-methylcytosine-specific restriction endonuclease McrA
MKYALKLDAAYRPLDVVDCFKSTSMVLAQRAKAIEFYNEEIHPGIKIPSVIVLKTYVRKYKFFKRCNRSNVVWRDKNTCQYCGNYFSFNNLTLDHVLPKSKGGHKEWTNIVAACKPCNSNKGNKLLTETNLKLIKQPIVPYVSFADLELPCKIQDNWKKYI